MTKGLVITTFNSEDYFKELYHTIPFNNLDYIVIVNGGDEYKNKYDNVYWIQHQVRKYPSVARNDGLKYLLENDCDHNFILEDDMIIKNNDIFDHYIHLSEISKIEYFCFCSNAWDSGPVGNRTPKLKVQYNDKDIISFYRNMCNEFTYRSKRIIKEVGFYNESYRYIFDIENVFRISKHINGSPFWYFPDSAESDSYIMNNPNAVTRINAGGERDRLVGEEFLKFEQENGLPVNKISELSQQEVIDKLIKLKNHD